MSEYELRERVLQLERQLQTIQAEVQSASARQAILQSGIPLRIAEVVEVGSGKVCRVKFMDGSFNESVTEMNAQFVSRQVIGKFYAYNLGNGTPTVGSRIPVWEWSGHYWTLIGSSDNSSPSPPSEDVAMVWVDPNDGGLAAGDMQTAGTGCVWAGHKAVLQIEDGEFSLNFCSGSNQYENSTPIWVTAPPVGLEDTSVRFEALPLWVPHIGYRVKAAYAVGSDVRELWAVQPRLVHARLIEIGEVSDQADDYIFPDANDIYVGRVMALNANRTGLSIDDPNDGRPAVGTGAAIHAIDVQNRKPIRPGRYLGIEAYTRALSDGNTRPLYYFQSSDMNQAVQFESAGVTLGQSTSNHAVDFGLTQYEGVVPGIVFDTANDRFTFTYGGVYKLMLSVHCEGGASDNLWKAAVQKSTDGGATWSTVKQELWIKSGTGSTAGRASGHITELLKCNAGQMARVILSNVTQARSVSVGQIILVIERCYGDAEGGL